MRLYMHPFSSNARRALMTALHLQVPVERIVVDLAKREQKLPPYLAMNPNGRVPLLDDDGFLLWESRAIMTYLAGRTPGQTLYPTESRARADVDRWLFWCAAHFSPALGVLTFENFVKHVAGGGDPDPVEVARGEKLVAQFAPVLDAHLAGRTWVAGDAVTLADLSLAPPLALTHPAKLPVTGYPNLQAWFARVQELDAWKQTAA